MPTPPPPPDPRIQAVRDRINITETTALTDSAIIDAIADAEIEVRSDKTIALTDEVYNAAVLAYARYNALLTYASRGREVTSGHQDALGHFVSDAPAGLFDFRSSLAELLRIKNEWKATISPRMPVGAIRRFG